MRKKISILIAVLALIATPAFAQTGAALQREMYRAIGGQAAAGVQIAGYAAKAAYDKKKAAATQKDYNAIFEALAQESPLSLEGLVIAVEEENSYGYYANRSGIAATEQLLQALGAVTKSRRVPRLCYGYDNNSCVPGSGMTVDYTIGIGQPEVPGRDSNRVNQGGSIRLPGGYTVGGNIGSQNQADTVYVPLFLYGYRGSDHYDLASVLARATVDQLNTFYSVDVYGSRVNLGRNGGSTSQTDPRFEGRFTAIHNGLVQIILRIKADKARLGM
jgi:hypothetical protein